MKATFEIGKTYYGRFTCDYDTVYKYKVIKRTKATVTLLNLHTNEKQVNRISHNLYYQEGIESVYPMGMYSMCPILTAEKEWK